MASKALGILMRISVVATALCGLFICFVMIPEMGEGILYDAQEFSHWFTPWLIFAWIFAVPCFAILVYMWKVAGAIMRDTVFTTQTAQWVKKGSILMFSASLILFVGNMVTTAMSMTHPSVWIWIFIVEVFILAFALAAAVLSHYLAKAAILREENEGTL